MAANPIQQFANASIDELSIYDRALPASEIQDIFNASIAGKCKITLVEIDIKPGSDSNSINPSSNGVIPVAILTTSTAQGEAVDFDATTVDPVSVGFGPNGATETHGHGHVQDVDDDGDLDLVLHFRTRETGIQCGDTEASLIGESFDGQGIEGTDAIQTVGCGGKGKKVLAGGNIPLAYTLYENYPNPFNPSTTIRYELPKPSEVTITVYDLLGKPVRALVIGLQDAGYKSVIWDGKGSQDDLVSSGVYVYHIMARAVDTGEEFSQARKLILVR